MRNALIVAGVLVGGYFVLRWAQGSSSSSPAASTCGSCSGCVDCAQTSQMTHAGAQATDYGFGMFRGAIPNFSSRMASPGAFSSGPSSYWSILSRTVAAEDALQPSAPAPTTVSTTTLATARPRGSLPGQTPTYAGRVR